MRIQYQDSPAKLVYIWLSREEGQDKALLDSLKPQYAAWRADGNILKLRPLNLP